MIEQILQADRYLQVDQVAKARDVYQKVVDLDPGNAIAVVGLARCALSDGEDQQAYELASRALEIDPENDMARRMEARLSEILATRGEAVVRPVASATPSTHEMRRVVTDEPDGPTEPPATERASEPTPEPEPEARAAAPAYPGTEPSAAAPKPEEPAPELTTVPEPATGAAPEPAPEPMTSTPTPTPTSKPPISTKPKPPPSAKAKEPAVRKSLFDRLMGR